MLTSDCFIRLIGGLIDGVGCVRHSVNVADRTRSIRDARSVAYDRQLVLGTLQLCLQLLRLVVCLGNQGLRARME